MHELVERFHPNGWDDELFAACVRLAVIALISVGVAWASGPLLDGWLRRRAADHLDGARRTLSRVRLAVVLVGLYVGVKGLPISRAAMSVTDGTLFVLVVVLLANLLVHVMVLALRGYVARSAVGPERERAQREYLPLASTLVTIAFGLVAATMIAHHFGHDVSSLVTALGVGSLAIGLAAQQTLGNMIAGFLIMVDRPFRVGDRVRLQSGETGVIDQIGVRATRVLLPDFNLLVVPNSELGNTRVVNLSMPTPVTRGEVRCRVPWAIAAGAEQALAEVTRELTNAVVVVSVIEFEYVEVALRFDVPSDERSAVEDRLRGEVLAALLAAQAQGEKLVSSEPGAQAK